MSYNLTRKDADRAVYDIARAAEIHFAAGLSTRWGPPDSRRPRQSASLHGTTGLYFANASLFPTALGVTPMITIIAFAKQVAREGRGRRGLRFSRNARPGD